jgi:Ca2+:H+ antiporter
LADALSSLMIITAIALILPTALYSTFTTVSEIRDKILAFSRATAVLLLLTYGFYIYFQLGSHKQIFEAAEQEANECEQIEAENDAAGPQNAARDIFRPSAVLVVSALAIMACAHYVIDSVEGTAKLTGVAQSFIAAILVPIASNAPECAAVLAAARKQHINYALGVIVSSILQIGLFVLPILVVIGWCFDKPMTLYFQTSQTFLLFFAILVVNHLLQEGQYTYIHGAMLVAL